MVDLDLLLVGPLRQHSINHSQQHFTLVYQASLSRKSLLNTWFSFQPFDILSGVQ